MARLGSVVVRYVSLRVEPGRLVTMLGPNGAGKTTLPEALAGMLGFASGRSSMAARAGDLVRARGAVGRLAGHPRLGLPRDWLL